MRIAYLECFSGIMADMFLGALVDAGVPLELLTRTVAALGVDARLEISRVERSGISATKLDVIAAGEKELPREEFWRQESPATPHSHPQDHEHEHAHAHSHPHNHSHPHSHEHDEGQPHRGLSDIR